MERIFAPNQTNFFIMKKYERFYTEFTVEVAADMIALFLRTAVASWQFTSHTNNLYCFRTEIPFGSLDERRISRILDSLVSNHLVISYYSHNLRRTF